MTHSCVNGLKENMPHASWCCDGNDDVDVSDDVDADDDDDDDIVIPATLAVVDAGATVVFLIQID